MHAHLIELITNALQNQNNTARANYEAALIHER